MEEEERARGEGKQGVFLATTISAIATAAGVCNNRKMRGRISKGRGGEGERGGGELKKTQQEEFFLIVEQLPAGQCSAHNGQLFNLGSKQAAGEEGGGREAVIHVFMQPNKTQFRTYRKPNKTKFRTYRKGNKHYRRQETRNKIFLQKQAKKRIKDIAQYKIYFKRGKLKYSLVDDC